MPPKKIKSALHVLSALAMIASSTSIAGPPVAPKDKYAYKPIKTDFWKKTDEAVEKEHAFIIFNHASPAADAEGPEKDEWRLGIAKALSAVGMPLHAQYLLTTVASKSIGTRQGFEALRILNQVVRDQVVDETALEELAFELDTKVDEPESRSMIGYLRARGLFKKGYQEWAQIALADVVPATTYGQELEFDRAQQALNSGDSVAAYGKFEGISKNPAARTQTQRLSRLALARLIFERKDYRAAVATYSKIDLATRERARSLNELTWTYYYDRAFGRALGTIQALKTPYFRPLLSPETLLVEMLIYRELCHFKHVQQLVKEFLAEYKPIYTTIEDRKPLEKLPEFQQMALQEGLLQKRATAIQFIRMERRELEKLSWSDEALRKELLKLGEKRERLIDAEINRLMISRVDTLANWFLDLREQVWFLEYESSMRMIQLNDDQADHYVPPKADKTRPDILFWPVSGEAWLDELMDYEVLVQDQCGNPKARRPFPFPRGGGRK